MSCIDARSNGFLNDATDRYPEQLADKSFDNTGRESETTDQIDMQPLMAFTVLLEAPFDPIRRQACPPTGINIRHQLVLTGCSGDSR